MRFIKMMMIPSSSSMSTSLIVRRGQQYDCYRCYHILYQSHINNNNKNDNKMIHPRISSSSVSSSSVSVSLSSTILFSSYSRMLDMGGSSPEANSLNKKPLRANVSKNSQIQAICFDFDVLTKSFEIITTPTTSTQTTQQQQQQEETTTTNLLKLPITPDLSVVESVAKALKINILQQNGETSTRRSKIGEDTTLDDDDLSLLLGGGSKTNNNNKNNEMTTTTTTTKNNYTPGGNDIGYKYADKLSKKGIQGGILGVQVAKQQIEDTTRKGDAAGHLLARQMLAKLPQQQPIDSKDGNIYQQRWMASTGTGTLLKFLTFRSIKIALLPTLMNPTSTNNNNKNQHEGQQMDELQKQLQNHVVFDIIHKDGSMNPIDMIQQHIMNTFQLGPNQIIVVSDKDSYIQAAKNSGLVTVRIRPPNTRNGNISAHYTIQSIPELHDTINEINGISFNSVLHSK